MDQEIKCLWMVGDEEQHSEIWDIIFELEGIVAEEELMPGEDEDYE